MARTILVPLDGTRNAENALDALEHLCSSDDRIILLKVEKPEALQATGVKPGRRMRGSIVGPAGGIRGVVSPNVPTYAETSEQVRDRQIDESKSYLERLASPIRQRGHMVETEVAIGSDVDEAIVTYARRVKPDFIAMLRRTHLGLGERLFGSVATSVVRSEVAPVLFVPAQDAQPDARFRNSR